MYVRKDFDAKDLKRPLSQVQELFDLYSLKKIAY